MTVRTILEKGRVTLGEALLDHLGVRPGEKLELDMLPGGRISLRAAVASGDEETRKQPSAGPPE